MITPAKKPLAVQYAITGYKQLAGLLALALFLRLPTLVKRQWHLQEFTPYNIQVYCMVTAITAAVPRGFYTQLPCSGT